MIVGRVPPVTLLQWQSIMSSRGYVIGPGPTTRHLVVADHGHSIYICIGRHLCRADVDDPLAASIVASYDQTPRLIATSSKKSHIVAAVPSTTSTDALNVYDATTGVLEKTRSALPTPIICIAIGDDLIIYLTKTRVAVCRWPSLNPIAVIDAIATAAIFTPGSRFILTGPSHYLREMHAVGTGVVQQTIPDRYDDDFLDLIYFCRLNLVLVASSSNLTSISGGKALDRKNLSTICTTRNSETITMLTKTGKDSFVVSTSICFLRRFTIVSDPISGSVNMIHIGDIHAGSEIIDVVPINLNELLCIRRGRTPALIDLAASEIKSDKCQTTCANLGLTPVGQRKGFLTVSADGVIRLWDSHSRRCMFQVKNETEERRPLSVSASPNGFQLCIVVQDSVLLYYILHDGFQLHRSWNCVGVSRACYSHSGHAIAVCAKNYVYVLHALDMTLMSMSAKHSSPVSTFAWSPNDQLLVMEAALVQSILTYMQATCSGFDICSIFQPSSGRLISQVRIATSFNDVIFLDEHNIVAATVSNLQSLTLDDSGIVQIQGEPINLGPLSNIENIALDRARQRLYLSTSSGYLIAVDYGSKPYVFKIRSSLPLHGSLFFCSVISEPGIVLTAGIDGMITVNADAPDNIDELSLAYDDCIKLISSSDLDALQSVNQQMANKVTLLESTTQQQIEMVRRSHVEEVERVRQELCDIIEEQAEKIHRLSSELERARAEHKNQMVTERTSEESRFGRLIAELEAKIAQQSKDAFHRERSFRDLLTQHNEEIEAILNRHKDVVEGLQGHLDTTKTSAVNIVNKMDRTLKETIADYEETLHQLEEEREFEINGEMVESKHALLAKDEQLTKSSAYISSLNQRIDTIKHESDNKSFHIDTLESEIISLRGQIEDLKAALNESQEILRQREVQIGNISQDVAKISAERAALLSANVLLKQKLVDLEDHQKAYPGCIKELNEKIESMDQELLSGNKSVQEMKRVSTNREEVLQKLKVTACHLERSFSLKRRQYHSLANEIRVLVEETHEDKWFEELHEIYNIYKLSRISRSDLDIRSGESFNAVDEGQKELLRQREQLRRTVGSLQKNVSNERNRNKVDQSKRIQENRELLMEVQDLRKQLIVKDLEIKKLQEPPERRVCVRPKSSWPKPEKRTNPSRQVSLNYQIAMLAHRNERMEDELEDAQHRIAETSFHRNKLQEALVVALSWAGTDTKRQAANFLQEQLEEPIDQGPFRKRVMLPKSASAATLDRRYKQERKRPQSTLVNFRIPL